jgi:NADPH-dependent 2,4-dienoyl-CoA reductase/sulfur reductase-like enzyme
MQPKKLMVVGGGTGGASCAARARRLSELSEITIFERGPHVSFASWGLPYYVSGVIKKENDLLMASPEVFRKRLNIDVRIHHDVRRVFPQKKEIEIHVLTSGRIYRERYDALVLSPGSEPIKPSLEGIELPGIFTLRTIPDSHEIIRWIKSKSVRRAVVAGGGFAGLEMTESLNRMGIQTTIVEMQPQLMPFLDSEMAQFLHDHLIESGVTLCLNSAATAFKPDGDSISVILASGQTISTDLVILSVGIRPKAELAVSAGLRIGETGGIWVDDRMQTSDENIWAVGNAVEVKDRVMELKRLIPLAGSANRQGRVAADNIFGDGSKPHRFRGSLATVVCSGLGMAVASTGLSEKCLKKINQTEPLADYEKIYLHPDYYDDEYYPAAVTLTIKLIFSRKDGRILGAQAVGPAGVEKTIDVIAMAIQKNATVYDLEEADLCYTPQFVSAQESGQSGGKDCFQCSSRTGIPNTLAGYTRLRNYILDVGTRKNTGKTP